MYAAKPGNVRLSSLNIAACSFLVDNFGAACDCAVVGSSACWLRAEVAGDVSVHAELSLGVSVRQARPDLVFHIILDFAAIRG